MTDDHPKAQATSVGFELWKIKIKGDSIRPCMGYFVNLGEFARNRTPMKFINCLLGEILPTGDVDSFEPASFAPAPRCAWCYANLLQPFGKADNGGPGIRMCFVV